MNELVLPELGEGIKEATVVCWHVKAGSRVEKDEDIVEVVTDKASFNIPSPFSGTIKKICIDPGETVPIGCVLAHVAP
ncbi:MAG TPA: hypothetical protein P5160_07310 [Candidatus Omnitrophota bacterium]|nr:hypothetical protein [Candidatus Omnitrophota bacterium]